MPFSLYTNAGVQLAWEALQGPDLKPGRTASTTFSQVTNKAPLKTLTNQAISYHTISLPGVSHT
jgi:hypothetical protein